MPRVPVRVQGQPFGTANPNGRSLVTQAAILQPGPAQPIEQFSAGKGLSPETARALNQAQENVRAATSQAKSDPTADKNIIEGFTLTQGGSSGAGPYNLVPHGLGAAYRGYRICTVRGGALLGHAAIAPTAATPASAYLALWTNIAPFGSSPVTVDIEVYK